MHPGAIPTAAEAASPRTKDPSWPPPATRSSVPRLLLLGRSEDTCNAIERLTEVTSGIAHAGKRSILIYGHMNLNDSEPLYALLPGLSSPTPADCKCTLQLQLLSPMSALRHILKFDGDKHASLCPAHRQWQHGALLDAIRAGAACLRRIQAAALAPHSAPSLLALLGTPSYL